jgi:hypothetical protein
MNGSTNKQTIQHCETCGRDVPENDYDSDAGECIRCQETRGDGNSSYVEEQQQTTAARAWKEAAKQHAKAVNSGEKTPGVAPNSQTDNEDTPHNEN